MLVSVPLLLALTACQTTTRIEPQAITYPAALFECRAIPSGADVTTDDQVAAYIAGLGLTAHDCKSQLAAVGDMLRGKPQ